MISGVDYLKFCVFFMEVGRGVVFVVIYFDGCIFVVLCVFDVIVVCVFDRNVC